MRLGRRFTDRITHFEHTTKQSEKKVMALKGRVQIISNKGTEED
jgi:hypothetical protein